MNTTKINTAARTTAVALLLCLTASATAALAQGPTTPLGGQSPSPSAADCPEYRDAVAKAKALGDEASKLIDFARTHDEIAKGYEKSVAYDRERLAGTREAVQRSQARLDRLKGENAGAADVANETAYLAGLQAELKDLEGKVGNEGASIAEAIRFHHMADAERAQAAKLIEEANALLDGAAAQCDNAKVKKDKKDKKEKKDKGDTRDHHSLRTGLFLFGTAVGAEWVLSRRP